IAALQNVVGYLSNLRGFGFLNDKIPLLNVSVGGMLDFAHDFGDKLQQLEANPADSLQDVGDAIATEFGLPAGSVLLSLDGTNLKTSLDFRKVFSDVTQNL